MMSVCTFFGHRECYGLDRAALYRAIENFITQGVTDFLVGHQGQFDAIVCSCLQQLQAVYPHIRVSVVLAYLPTEKQKYDTFFDTVYPEIGGHPKFAIEQRNRWMIHKADYCVCFINHTWGGAYKFARLAKHRGLTIINLGNTEF